MPEIVVRRRFTAGLINFFTLYQAIVDSWQVFDNSKLAGPHSIAWGEATSRLEIEDRQAWNHITKYTK